MNPHRFITRFTRDEDGGALVEFGLLLPTFLLVLGLAVEGGRTFWSYQTTVAGVRDATRYLSRVVQGDACASGATSTTAWDAKLAEIVRTAQNGDALFPGGVSVQSVTSALTCRAGTYRNGAAPVATVSATLRITYPFAGLIALTGFDAEPVTTVVRDEARMVGT